MCVCELDFFFPFPFLISFRKQVAFIEYLLRAKNEVENNVAKQIKNKKMKKKQNKKTTLDCLLIYC